MADHRSHCGREWGLVGDPVDVVSGAVLDETVDFVLDEPLPLVWTRAYDSRRGDEERPLGPGHTHALDHSLRFDLDGLLYRRPNAPPASLPHLAKPGDEASMHGVRVLRESDDRFVVTGHALPELRFTRGPSKRLFLLDSLAQGGRVIRLERDPDGSLRRIWSARGRRLDVLSQNGRVLSVSLGDAGTAKPLIRYTYDARGRLIEGRDAYQQRFSFRYDERDRLIEKKDRRGFAFYFAYDREGRCTRAVGEDGVLEVQLEYRPAELATLVTEATGGEWVYQHDATGNLTSVIDPLGGVRDFQRDERGRLEVEVSPTGAVTRFLYDDAGARIASVDPTGRRSVLPAPANPGPRDMHRVASLPLQWELGDLESIGFDAADDFPAHLWPGAETAALRRPPDEPALAPVDERRDEQGLLLSMQRPGGGQCAWSYDPNGNVRRFTDFDGRAYHHQHASWNHRVAEEDPLGRVVQLAYTRTEKLASVIDPGGTQSEYVYDAKDRLIAVRRAGRVRDYYGYDLDDHLTEKRDAFGRVLLSLSYDRAGHLEERRLTSGDVHRFRYDRAGRYLEAASDAGKVSFAYDGLGHRSRDMRDGAGVEHVYRSDRLTRTTVLGRFSIAYTRETDGTVGIADPTGARHALRRLAPGVWRRELADGLHELTQFTPEGRCLSKTAFNAEAEAAPWTREYAYSGEGDLLVTRDSSRGATYYAHDEAHQLRSVRRDHQPPESFVYDAASNLLAQPGLTGVTIGEGNRLYAANGDAFEYDRRHNLSKRSSYDGTSTVFHHDSRDQLVRIDVRDGSTWEAQYDALGRRTKKRFTRGDVVLETTYHWDTDRLAAEQLPDGKLRIYVYADDFAMVPVLFVEYESIDAAPESGRRYYLFTDHQGTPELVRDQSGAAVWWARREPYGVVVEGGHDFHQPFRFPGHWADPETGLHYNRFRYYSPELGRYLQTDPFGIAGGINTHAYTDNPTHQVDIRGLDCTDRPALRREAEDRSDHEVASSPIGRARAAEMRLRGLLSRAARSLGLMSTPSPHPSLSALHPEAQRLAALSATLTHQLDHLAQHKWKIRTEPFLGYSSGSYAITEERYIRIDPTLPPEAQASTLAHEVGHALYDLPPETSAAGVTKETFVSENTRRHLDDEAEAQINAAGVRDEVRAAGGPDIGMPGSSNEYGGEYETYRTGHQTRTAARLRMGDLMAKEHMSTTGQQYGAAFDEHYGSLYDAQHTGDET